MNIYKDVQQQIKQICDTYVSDLALESINLDAVNAEPSKDPSHGDIATNAAMVLAKPVGKKPRDVAEAIKPDIEALKGVEKVDIAGPGFINITHAPSIWQALIPEILANPSTYGSSQIGAGQRVNIEYVSANPTGPMHVGHGRGAVFGDALALLLEKASYEVTREYYINDGGAQIDKLIDSAHLRYREACGETIGEIPEGLYPGDYLIPVGEKIKAEHAGTLIGVPASEYRSKIRDLVVGGMMQLIKDDLAMLGIHHDIFTSEARLTQDGRTEQAIAALENMGLIYQGVLDPPKGKMVEDWEPAEQTLFKSSEFGDDLDRAVKKSDGSWAYFAPDIALHYDKIQRGYTRLIDVFGADHGGYVKRISAAVKALGEGKVEIQVKLCQLVKFIRGGEPLKMSKRAGTFITVREVVEEVGKDVFRFIMLTRKNDAPLDFDFDAVKEQTKDNPVFYVQYAHARCKSVLRHAEKDFAESVKLADAFKGTRSAAEEGRAILPLLRSDEELDLMKMMAQWPRIVESAALAAEPHRVAFYLTDLAACFHSLWNKGQGDLTLRFLQKDAIEETAAKLAMVQAFAATVASGLYVLGVQPLEEL